MAYPELQAIKEEIIKIKADIGQLREDIKSNREILQRKRLVLYGNGSGIGLINKVGNISDILKGIKEWQAGWREITNYEDFKQIKQEVKFLSRWNWIIIGGLSIITVMIQVFGHKVVEAFF